MCFSDLNNTDTSHTVHVLRQVHKIKDELRQCLQNPPSEAVVRESYQLEGLREGAEGVRDGGRDAVAIEGDSVEVGDQREPKREVSGEVVIEEDNGF
ncbi:hypothetical protein GYH30_012437 [Glycine max]|nr:hypothetical protein GYH30_012437 [Glycine max]